VAAGRQATRVSTKRILWIGGIVLAVLGVVAGYRFFISTKANLTKVIRH
jgi:hypothetical protein